MGEEIVGNKVVSRIIVKSPENPTSKQIFEAGANWNNKHPEESWIRFIVVGDSIDGDNVVKISVRGAYHGDDGYLKIVGYNEARTRVDAHYCVGGTGSIRPPNDPLSHHRSSLPWRAA